MEAVWWPVMWWKCLLHYLMEETSFRKRGVYIRKWRLSKYWENIYPAFSSTLSPPLRGKSRDWRFSRKVLWKFDLRKIKRNWERREGKQMLSVLWEDYSSSKTEVNHEKSSRHFYCSYCTYIMQSRNANYATILFSILLVMPYFQVLKGRIWILYYFLVSFMKTCIFRENSQVWTKLGTEVPLCSDSCDDTQCKTREHIASLAVPSALQAGIDEVLYMSVETSYLWLKGCKHIGSGNLRGGNQFRIFTFLCHLSDILACTTFRIFLNKKKAKLSL